MYRITADAAPERLRPTLLAAGGITEADLQGWIIDDELLIITAEYGGFGWLRDRVDATTDLQALKYASDCAMLTAGDLQGQDQRLWSSIESIDSLHDSHLISTLMKVGLVKLG